MSCESCVFYDRLKQSNTTTPCISCTNDPSDKGYCVAIRSDFGPIPVITKIFDEGHARAIIARGIRTGNPFELLHWSCEIRAYQPT